MPNKELIYREDLIAEYDRAHKGPAGGARRLMVEAPAVDAVKVVRCKDCANGRNKTKNTVICKILGHVMLTSDFCSFGAEED